MLNISLVVVKILGVMLGAGSGIFGLLTSFKNAKGKITTNGQIALGGIVLGSVLSVTSLAIESLLAKKNAESAAVRLQEELEFNSGLLEQLIRIANRVNIVEASFELEIWSDGFVPSFLSKEGRDYFEILPVNQYRTCVLDILLSDFAQSQTALGGLVFAGRISDSPAVSVESTISGDPVIGDSAPQVQVIESISDDCGRPYGDDEIGIQLPRMRISFLDTLTKSEIGFFRISADQNVGSETPSEAILSFDYETEHWHLSLDDVPVRYRTNQLLSILDFRNVEMSIVIDPTDFVSWQSIDGIRLNYLDFDLDDGRSFGVAGGNIDQSRDNSGQLSIKYLFPQDTSELLSVFR